MELEAKINTIRELLKNKKILLAFSGGADSTVVAKIASEVAKSVLAVTIDNGVMPSSCIQNAENIARQMGIDHMVISEDYLLDEHFKENKPNRCFICRNKMYSKLETVAQEKGFKCLVDGTNISDLLEDRPGIMVNYQKNIFSPLVESGMTQEDVLYFLKKENLEFSTSTTCLATRISTGSEITTKKINRISYAESLIKNLSSANFIRVRDQGDMGIIEVDSYSSLLNPNTLQHIDSELKAVGFKKVVLDIGDSSKKKKDLVVYKPCKDELNKIMFETELPYPINIELTCIELEKMGIVKCSPGMGIAMLEVEGRNVTIFKKGKIVARRVKDQEDAQKLLIKVLPKIRRFVSEI
ncbi:ATP-dependent sacrificial sulfur transferase LarE [Methanobacterium movens]